MIFQTPKIPLTDLKVTDIVQQAKEERLACQERLSTRIKKKLDGRVASFLKLHKIDHHLREAANHGLNEVRIPIQQKFMGANDLSEPIEELYDGHFDVRVMYNHNAFFEALEAHVFKEDNIEGRVVFGDDENHRSGLATELFISWQALTPSPRSAAIFFKPASVAVSKAVFMSEKFDTAVVPVEDGRTKPDFFQPTISSSAIADPLSGTR